MDNLSHNCDVAIVGSGPAGLAAAQSATGSGERITVIDDNAGAGGQIWRGEHRVPSKQAAPWINQSRSANVRFIHGARVFSQPVKGVLLAESATGVYELSYSKLILATGARELFLPFEGWTLPGVAGAGGLQAMVKSGLPIGGKRVVVAGSGPLLLAVAAYLRKRGARVLLVAEQATRRQVIAFARSLLKSPGKAMQAIKLKRELSGVPYLFDCWPVSAQGDESLRGVTLRSGDRKWSIESDYLACGFHLVPNSELAALLECEIELGRVRVDEFQETSIEGIYSAGEATGIGGLDLSIVEGQIAGFAAAGRRDRARELFAARDRHKRFADDLNRAFTLREELKSLAAPETIVCRCEDVTSEQLRKYDSWKLAKLQTRCGMGPCQGRVCGPAVEFLFDWRVESVRPPVFPVRVGSLIHEAGDPHISADVVSRVSGD